VNVAFSINAMILIAPVQLKKGSPMKKYLSLSLFILAATFPSVSAQAQILVHETFTRTNASIVRNTAASPVAGPVNWAGSPGFTVQSNTLRSATTGSGHVLNMDFGINYFSNNPGIYTLTADVFFSSAMTASAQSWQIGFNNATSTSAGANRSLLSTDGHGGAPGIILRGDGQASVKAVNNISSVYNSSTGAFPANSVYALTLVLDTSSANWTTDAFIGSTQLDLNGVAAGNTYTYTTNPTIRYATIASTITTANQAEAYLDNFMLTFTPIPEPSSFSLIVLGTLAWVASRRRSRSTVQKR
jgi:hypothetical protein